MLFSLENLAYSVGNGYLCNKYKAYHMKLFYLIMTLTCCHLSLWAGDVVREGASVTIHPKEGVTKVVRLQVISDKIIRVQETCEKTLPKKPKSLIIVEQKETPEFTVNETPAQVEVKAKEVTAVVNKKNGQIAFLDRNGEKLLSENTNDKFFKPFRVPDRELGSSNAPAPTEAQRNGFTWRIAFDSPEDEAFYGLGQHQSEELNMKNLNEDLFQYNTKVSVPFVISSFNYGLLWDSYSYCRFGNPNDYRQLGQVFHLYDKNGKEGHLTGTYTDRQGRQMVREEDSLYFEYDVPSPLANTDKGGIRNLPKNINLNESKVVYEGYIQAPENNLYQFILYYAGYVKVFIGDREVVAERWRTAWNPNAYKFSIPLQEGTREKIRIEWQPDGATSYLGLRVAEPRTKEQRGQLSIWSEMNRDLDYYFIAGRNMDEVISGYRTLTGQAPVYPKWALGFWQSRERYKTADEVTSTLSEFRKRRIPIDNIVQDWNYWKEDDWGSHNFEKTRYPDPQAMLDKVHDLHGRFMISVWPKFYCTTNNYQQLDQKGWMYHQAVTDDIHDWVGPGYVGSFYDAYSEGARKMFWKQLDDHLYSKYNYGIDAWWMDASEPNVRDCTPMWYRKALCGPTELGTSTEYFNAYSLVNADAIYKGQRATNPNQRVFLLTRSGFAGEQRYSTATWSGDIGTRWEDMRAQMTAGMNYSLSGLPFWGMDQGGFCVENRYVRAQQIYDQTKQENEDLKEWRELQARWNQFGCFIPIYRAHGQWPLREVWNIAPEGHPAYESIVWYHRLRYHLMPYLYSMTGWVHLHDYTMMRALVMDFCHDSNTKDIKDQWMFGPSLMACPVSHYQARSRQIYFPAGRSWYNLYTGQKVIGREGSNEERLLTVDAPYERIPVFVPEGSIIPFGPAMEWSDEKPAETIHLYIYAGKNADFQLYEDEGINYNYEKGLYATIDIHYDDAQKKVTLHHRKGSFPGMPENRKFNIVWVTGNHSEPLSLEHPKGTMVEYTGQTVSVSLVPEP